MGFILCEYTVIVHKLIEFMDSIDQLLQYKSINQTAPLRKPILPVTSGMTENIVEPQLRKA